MKNSTFKLFLLGIVSLLVFLLIFSLLQNELFYKATLGKISQNYERVGSWNDFQIRMVSKPYVEITSENFEQWDADIYRCIKERMYSTDEGCYHKVRGAFFPLFPLVWKISCVNSLGISIINYLIFILSISLLISYLLPRKDFEKMIIFAVLITFPSTVIYYIPYTEALFLLTTSLIVIGIIKQKYWVYFIATILLAMVRPATIFVLFSFLAVDFMRLFVHKSFLLFLLEAAKKTIPFGIGYFLSIGIQYLYTSSWTTLFDAQAFWLQSDLTSVDKITDWSGQGFGLSSFAIFFICIPALIYVVYTLFNKNLFLSVYKTTSKQENNYSLYLFSISLFYFIGIFVFILLTSKGNFHSFFRFIMASPFFYIAAIIAIRYFEKLKAKFLLSSIIIPMIMLGVFLYLVDFGGSRFDFKFVGLYLSIVSLVFLLLQTKLNKQTQTIIASCIVLFNLVWTSYLLNIFFCNGWIFT